VSGWQPRGGSVEKLWQVTAHDVRSSADGRSQWFRQITDGILYRDGQPVARFTAGQGQGDQVQNTFTIHGGAHVRLEGDGTELSTDEVQWRGPQRQLWLPRPIHLTRGALHLEGARSHLDLQAGRLTSEFVSGSSDQFHFAARHGVLSLKERRLELSPVAFQLPVGQGHARRVVYFAEAGRFQAQEVQMKFTISPAAIRSAAATGLTLALVHAAAGAPAPEAKTRSLDIKGTNFTYTERTMDLDEAWIKDKDTTITADHMHFDKDAAGKWERIIATGKPKAWNERDEVTGEKMTVLPKERHVVVEGHFRVEVKPKPGEEPSEDKSDLKGQVKHGTMTGDRLEYDYKNKNVSAEGNLKMASGGRTATGEKLFYTDKTEEVQFIGPVHAHDEKGQVFDTATGLTLALNKTGVSHVPGKFTATLIVPDEEEEPGTSTPGSTPSTDGSQKATSVPTPTAPDKAPPSEKKSP
jgi:lipopolysaccharide export system protein LptA